MAYYQGDYYQGDYYQGDPFLGALIGGAVSWLGRKIAGKKAAQMAGGAMTKGAGGTMKRIAGRYLPSVLGGAAIGAVMPSGPSAAQPFQIPLPGGGVFRPGRILPGGVPAISPGCCPSGFHFNKSTSHAKATFGAPPGSICVKNRSMNVANPRALRRGLRRVAGFGKLAMRAKKDVRRAAKSLGA